MFTLRQIKFNLLKPIPLVSWFLTSVLAGVSGPFQSALAFPQPFLTLYWAVISAGSIILGMCIVMIFENRKPPWDLRIRAAVIALVFSSVNTVFITLTNIVTLPDHFVPSTAIWTIFLISASIMLFILLIRHYLIRPVEPSGEIQFLKRIKPELGRDLIRLRGQDHYVEICTARGKDMILMRFSDALHELSGFDGLQVHRSHWVSKAAVENVDRSGKGVKLQMKDGSEIPVSRSFRAAVKGSGLL